MPWRACELDVEALLKKRPRFEHFETVRSGTIEDDSVAIGTSIWTTMQEPAIAICWEWFVMPDGVTGIYRPMEVCSNARLIIPGQGELTREQSCGAWLATLQSLDWQRYACAAAGTRPFH